MLDFPFQSRYNGIYYYEQVLNQGDACVVKVKKKERQQMLLDRIKEKPFQTDEALAAELSVSVQTIRLDRLELGIPELRSRVREAAESARENAGEPSCEITDLELGHSGTSLLHITEDMVFEGTQAAVDYHIFSQANSLARAVVDAPKAAVGVANVKYKIPVHPGENLVARAEVVRVRGNKYFVRVETRNDAQEVFRAKFILVSGEGQGNV